ncbi:MAG: CAAX prenyl protease-related protein [Desulfuromonadaceae bacterium]|nr:CAAX prenyl protease-related protein [Desulfuromonadaceae bacterium]MDD5107399.1 CAAX prenyl protease-related protein [Desulfuromonadaceae bacterium]
MSQQVNDRSALYRYLPFTVFMGFIGLDELIRFIAGQGLYTLEASTLYYLYPIKAATVGYLLYRFRSHYSELNSKDLANIPATLLTCGVGLLVFVLWINMTWTPGAAGAPQGFNPSLLPGQSVRIFLTLCRIAGAVLVVPLMEELFWRSFLIRSIIVKNFDTVPIGTFTWGSFLITVVLFGLEHNYILAGIMAGVIYNLLLYRTRSLAHCILAHAVTNFALAVYVVTTGKWQFW